MVLVSSIRDLANIELHDAVLGDVELRMRERSCAVKLLMFETPESRQRVGATLSFEGITSCVASLDFRSLVDNARSGNVSNCRVDIDHKITRLYLADGLLEITADSVSLVTDIDTPAP